jgi:adenylyltransferase/sulfurtransferase
LQRQIIYSENEIFHSNKIYCAKKRLNELNSEVTIDAYNSKFDFNNAEDLVKKYDVIVDGCDNFETRYLINDVCVKYDKPYVFGAVSEFSGQVSVFNYNRGATYRDLFPNENDLEAKTNGILGVLPGVIGSIEANEVIKIITGIGEVLSNKIFSINMLTMESNLFKIG